MTALLVEFTGPAGSGKTTLCSSVAEKLRHAGVTVAVVHPRKFLSSYINPRIAFPAFWWVLLDIVSSDLCCRKRPRRILAIKKLFAGYVTLLSSLHEHVDVVLIDEGPFQKRRTASGLLGRVFSGKVFRTIKDHEWPRPEMVFVLTADQTILEERRKLRGDRLGTVKKKIGVGDRECKEMQHALDFRAAEEFWSVEPTFLLTDETIVLEMIMNRLKH